MRGFVKIPVSIYCKLCKECGARPVIAKVEDVGYVVKCPGDNSHYQTMPGLIDIEDWNRNNQTDKFSQTYARCHDFRISGSTQ